MCEVLESIVNTALFGLIPNGLRNELLYCEPEFGVKHPFGRYGVNLNPLNPSTKNKNKRNANKIKIIDNHRNLVEFICEIITSNFIHFRS